MTGCEETTMKTLSGLDWVCIVLLIIGGLNWGLLGFFKIDLVATLLGNMTLPTRIVYDLVGLAAIYMIYLCAKLTKK